MKKKFHRLIIFLISISFILVALPANPAEAETYSANYIYPFNMSSDGDATGEIGNTLSHAFKIDSSSKLVTYKKVSSHCWQMTSSDYFTVSGEYFLCWKTSGGIVEHFPYVKVATGGTMDTVYQKKVDGFTGISSEQKSYLEYNANPATSFEYKMKPLFDHTYPALSFTLHEMESNTKAPYIELPGSNEFGRPRMKLRFKYLISKNGTITLQDNVMYFMYESTYKAGGGEVVEDQYKNIGIKIFWATGVLTFGSGFTANAVDVGDINNYSDDSDSSGADVGWNDLDITAEANKNAFFKAIVNKIFNENDTTTSSKCGKTVGPLTGTTESNWNPSDTVQASCINLNGTNIDKDSTPPSIDKTNPLLEGYMGKDNWNIGGNEASASSTEGSAFSKNSVCGTTFTMDAAAYVARIFCILGEALNKVANNFVVFATTWLKATIGFK